MTGHFNNGRWITIDPKLKAWYEEDILFIDSLLSHLKPGTERYNRLVMERKRRVELIENCEWFKHNIFILTSLICSIHR